MLQSSKAIAINFYELLSHSHFSLLLRIPKCSNSPCFSIVGESLDGAVELLPCDDWRLELLGAASIKLIQSLTPKSDRRCPGTVHASPRYRAGRQNKKADNLIEKMGI